MASAICLRSVLSFAGDEVAVEAALFELLEFPDSRLAAFASKSGPISRFMSRSFALQSRRSHYAFSSLSSVVSKVAYHFE